MAWLCLQIGLACIFSLYMERYIFFWILLVIINYANLSYQIDKFHCFVSFWVIFSCRKYVHLIYWSKICPILLLVKNMSTLFSGRKSVRRKNVPVPSLRLPNLFFFEARDCGRLFSQSVGRHGDY